MKAYFEVEIKPHAFLISALDGGEWSASRLGALPQGKEPLVPIGWARESVWMPGTEPRSSMS
jgi:hypothetical protein